MPIDPIGTEGGVETSVHPQLGLTVNDRVRISPTDNSVLSIDNVSLSATNDYSTGISTTGCCMQPEPGPQR
jgi:hypothetical protein